MSQEPDKNKCTILINGVEHEARPGQMLIEVTDAAGIYVPRFCYHSKLSIAANCRMCLVELENIPKPMPACATPVTPGMKVQTKSARAIGAQKATMEFLLINHPLDCPICDQGGECELQDLAMGFGRDLSRFTERKRVVKDKNIGPLVSTDMTRCIHCTRCVRFTQEIAGYQELGTIGRGDTMEISPYLERSVNHELSGNIIDLCPVGALNSKPYRFSARAWEMTQSATVAPHDCIGSNLYAHVMHGRVKRVVPRHNEAVNETWLADRDRFSYEGIYSADRLEQPMIRDGDGWRTVSWDEALEAATAGLRRVLAAGADAALGAFVSPSSTVEEGYLLARIAEHLGTGSIDSRLRRRDFRTQDSEPVWPGLGVPIAAVEGLRQILIIGSNLRKEVPLLAHRVRKAALHGAGVSFLNPGSYEYLFPVADNVAVAPAQLWIEVGRLLKAAIDGQGKVAPAVKALLAQVPEPADWHRRLAASLREGEPSAILLGHLSLRHPRFGEIALLAAELARVTGATLGFITEGANAAGLALAGVLPHRGPGGKPRTVPGATVAEMLATPPRGFIVLGAEPEFDFADGTAAVRALRGAEFVLALSPYLDDATRRWAHVVLPVGTFAETSGTFVNAEGLWQSFAAVAQPVGEARPAWKVLRVLGNRLGLPDCEYATSEAIRDQLKDLVGTPEATNGLCELTSLARTGDVNVSLSDLEVGIYRTDALVRRAPSLQLTEDGLASVAAVRRSA